MFEDFKAWCLEHHKGTREWGHAMIWLGGAMLLAGAAGRLMLLAHSFGQKNAPASLADLGLPFPTFFVPESFWGVAFALSLIFAGAIAVKSIERFYAVAGIRRRDWLE